MIEVIKCGKCMQPFAGCLVSEIDREWVARVNECKKRGDFVEIVDRVTLYFCEHLKND